MGGEGQKEGGRENTVRNRLRQRCKRPERVRTTDPQNSRVRKTQSRVGRAGVGVAIPGADSKESACNAGDSASLGREDPLEKGMATHSRIPAWRIPWTEEPRGLQSMGLQSQTQLKELN